MEVTCAMSHEDHHEDKETRSSESTRRRPSTRKTTDSGKSASPGGFITKDDLSQFLSLKPYLSENAQAIVDLLAELEKSAGKLDPGALGKLAGLFGGGDNANLSALTSLAGMAGTGGKLDPTALVSLLGMLGQGSLGQGLLGQGLLGQDKDK